jgi:hypothetical protein
VRFSGLFGVGCGVLLVGVGCCLMWLVVWCGWLFGVVGVGVVWCGCLVWLFGCLLTSLYHMLHEHSCKVHKQNKFDVSFL